MENTDTVTERPAPPKRAAGPKKGKVTKPVKRRSGGKFTCTRGARRGKPCGYSSNIRDEFYFHQSGPSEGKVICCVDCESKRGAKK